MKLHRRSVGAARTALFAVTLLSLATAPLSMSVSPAVAQPAPSQQTPQTIPALREWQGAPGSYRFGPESRIVADSELSADAAVFADDLRLLTGRSVPVVADGARPGDLVLAEGGAGKGYTLTVAKTLTVAGTDSDAVFAGTRSVLQLIKQSPVIPAGTAHDWADTNERSVMLDVARKYYPLPWIRDFIRDLSYLKYTDLQLHLSDDQAFRLESDQYPQIVSAQHYSKQDMRDLVAFASRYHITIIPEIDMPGHMTQILSSFPQLRLTGADGTVKDGSLDLSQPGAVELAKNLLSEYLPLFPGKVFSIGADEWLPERQLANFPQLDAAAKARFGPNARGRDLYYDFVNQANAFIRAQGKTTRIWNDQIVTGYQVQIDPNVQISAWYAGSPVEAPQPLVDAGHEVINANSDMLYYIVGISHPNPADIYESFTPSTFAGGNQVSTDAVQFSVWADLNPDLESNAQVAWGLFRPLRAFAQSAWSKPVVGSTYDAFVPLIERVGHAPGFSTPTAPIGTVPSSTVPAIVGHSLDNIVDGRSGTYFQGARDTRPGDTVTLDLGSAEPLGTINLDVASRLQANLEVSSDGTSWQQAGTVNGPTITDAQLPSGTEGRFVRLRATAPAPALQLAEFGVTTVAASSPPLSTSLPAYDVYTLDKAHDNDPNTWFWAARGPVTGDYLLYDLGSAQAVHAITLLMSKPDLSSGDYLHQGVLETSVDGTTWTQVGAYSDQKEIHATTSGSARYVRFRVTASQGDWAIIREFSVQ